MEKIRRKGKAEGSVLFTVVSVMMVMVVFLMSTLVLTTSANRRSYYTYYENQAQYTAQGVLDAISNSAYNNPTFYKWVTELGENGVPDVGVVDVGLTFSDPDNRIPLTKDGQAIRATVETLKDESGNNKYNYIWDAETGAIRKQKGWKITVTASVGQGRNASEYTMANYIYENYRNPVISANQNRATWVITNTLQVTDSTLHTGNPSSDSPNKANAMYTGGGASFMSGNNLLCLGPQTFGITHTPLGNGRGGITANSSYNADTHSNVFANQSVTVGNGIFVGNFSTNDKIYFEFQQKGEGAQFWGNFTVTNFASFLSNINSFNESGTTAKTAYRDIPYIYCDGNLQFAENTQAKIGGDSGKKTQPVNIYANQMTHRPNDMMGDIFLFDPTKTSDLSSTQKTKLSRFVGDNIQKTNTTTPGYVAGDIISNNAELKISGCAKIGGDIIFTNPNGTLTIENVKDDGFEIGGARVCVSAAG